MTTHDDATVPVDEAARRRFEQFWAEGNPHPIEEFLPDRTERSYLPTLEELVLIDMEFAWKTASVRCQDTATAQAETQMGPPPVETYVRRFALPEDSELVRRLVLGEILLQRRFGMSAPSLDDYQRRFPELQLPETVFAGASGLGTDTAVGPRAGGARVEGSESFPRAFGPYQLLQLIGAGGMGVVYRAWQANLGREVAVKQLRADHLQNLPPEHRQALIDRFRNESRATARIDHAHIVAVHDVGEIDGVPYYAMRYVAGSSLADVVRSGLPPPREAARLCRDVAQAVQAAHDHGILHRDLKPHNIIVAADSRIPFVADFGLAKLLDDESSPTVTGEILGTPQYMSPEQVQDPAGVTTRSDVYALGAVLYFLLTGQPPFPGRSHLAILRQLMDSRPAPPSTLNPDVDSDLQIICLKCLQPEPQTRYASAAALADDLSNWLDGLPIAARPPGRGERLWRWCRRNPLPSLLGAATAAALLFGIGALWVGFTRASKANADARASADSARAAVNDFFTIVSEDVLLNRPALQPLRRNLLRRALAHYQEFLKTNDDDPDLRAEIAATHYRVGRIKEQLESPAAALPSYDAAAALQRSLLRERPGDPRLERDLSATLNASGACLTRLRRFDPALAAFDEARTIRAGLAARPDLGAEERIEFQRLLANTDMNIGIVHKNLRQFGTARQHIESSIAARNEVLGAAPADPGKLVRDQGMAYFNLANLDVEQDRLAAALHNAGRAIEHFQRVAHESPDDLDMRHRVATCHRLIGEICSKQLDLSRAEAAYAEEQAWMQTLAVENPGVVQYQEELARVLLMRAQCDFLQQEYQPAEALLAESCGRLAPLVERGLGSPAAISDLIHARCGLADVHLVREEWTAARQQSEQALPLAQRLVSEFPQQPRYSEQLQEIQNLINAAIAAATKAENPGKM